jgi:AcrR family transcriptional regulator
MARPTTIDDRQLLRAAQSVFLEKGIRATTAEVARRARVAEGSIFKRWKTKEELFRAAMEQLADEAEWLMALESQPGRDPRRRLLEVGLQAVEFFRKLLPCMMMTWSNPTKRGIPMHLSGPNPPPLRALRRVIRFFEVEIRSGRVRRYDPEILARAYLGGIQNYVFFEILMKAQDERLLSAETYLRGLIQLLWSGMEPHSFRKKGASA